MIPFLSVAAWADPIDLGVALGTSRAELVAALGPPDAEEAERNARILIYDGGTLLGGGPASERSYTLAPAGRGQAVVQITWLPDGQVRPARLQRVLGKPDHVVSLGHSWCRVEGHPGLVVIAGIRDGYLLGVQAFDRRDAPQRYLEEVCPTRTRR